MVVCEQCGRFANRDSRAEAGIKHLLVPAENAREAAVVNGVNVYAVDNLRQAVDSLTALHSKNPPCHCNLNLKKF
jgi:predicted ATPase with chaperone activity